MGWNYVATLNCNWLDEFFPGAAVDASGNLWLWSFRQTATVPLPQNGSSISVSTTTLTSQTSSSPPALIATGGQQVLAIWLENATQNLYYAQLQAGSTTIANAACQATSVSDAPFAALVNGTVFVTWLGTEGFYYSNVTSVGSSTTSPTVTPPVLFFNGTSTTPSYWLSPVVAATPGGGISLVFKGVGGVWFEGTVTGADNTLYYTSAADPSNPSFGTPVQITYTGSDGTTVTPQTLWRPSLAQRATAEGASLALVYPPGDAPGELHYLVGTVGSEGVTWAPPPGNAVPLDALLATAGLDGGPVKFSHPVGVWAAAPEPGDSIYLVVGDYNTPANAGPLYVVRFSG